MKKLNKILTYAASVMMVIAIVVCLMRGEWLEALLLSALLMAEWIIDNQSKPRKPFPPQNVTPVKVEE